MEKDELMENEYPGWSTFSETGGQKKTSKYSQQESNQWPSGYQSRCSTTELQDTGGRQYH